MKKLSIKSKRILVTGGAGFIGSHVVDALIAEGCFVMVYDNFSTGKRTNLPVGFSSDQVIDGDIRDCERLSGYMMNCDYVVHLAALVSVQESIRDPKKAFSINVEGTQNVFRAAHIGGVKKVVYASSAAVYGDSSELPLSEQTPVLPISPYGEHKLQNEVDARAFYAEGLSSVGFRFFNVFGERQDPKSPYSGVISIFWDRLIHEQPLTIYGDGQQTRDFVNVANIVQAILLALQSLPGLGIYNVATGITTSLNQLILALSHVSGKTINRHYVAPREGDIRDSASDISLICSSFGYVPAVSLVDGLSKMWHSMMLNSK